jgi:hypothetical protein
MHLFDLGHPGSQVREKRLACLILLRAVNHVEFVEQQHQAATRRGFGGSRQKGLAEVGAGAVKIRAVWRYLAGSGRDALRKFIKHISQWFGSFVVKEDVVTTKEAISAFDGVAGNVRVEERAKRFGGWL